jgi:hypothetical protein
MNQPPSDHIHIVAALYSTTDTTPTPTCTNCHVINDLIEAKKKSAQRSKIKAQSSTQLNSTQL